MGDQGTRRHALRTMGALALSSLVAGCSSDDGAGGSDTPLPEFGITELVFCAEEPSGYGQYEEQPDATYSPGATVWVYVDVVGFETTATDGDTVRTDLAERLTVRSADGDPILQDQYQLENEFRANRRDRYIVVNDISLPGSADIGEYGVEIELTDELGDATTTATGTFTVE